MFNALSGRVFVTMVLLTLTFACSAYIRSRRFKRRCRCSKRYSREDCFLIIGSPSTMTARTAVEVVYRGGRIVLASRNMIDAAKMKAVLVREFRLESNTVIIKKIDFASFEQIKKFVEALYAAFEQLGINKLAGVIITEELRDAPYELTVDQYDKMFQFNYLGPFLLIKCLDSLLKNHPDPRIITLSSGESSPCKYSDIAEALVSPTTRIDDRSLAYHISKVCIALMSLNWRGAHCVDPGDNYGLGFLFFNTPLKGVEGVVHALLKSSMDPSYKITGNNISSLCIEAIGNLRNGNENVLCGLLYRESCRNTYFISDCFEEESSDDDVDVSFVKILK